MSLIRNVSICLLVVCASAFAQTPSFRGLGDLPGGGFFSEAYAVSADGSVVVGQSEGVRHPEAVRWENGVITSLSSGYWGIARDVSADGSVVVGGGQGLLNGAFRWTQLDGFTAIVREDEYDWAFAVSADGQAVVGYAYHVLLRARRWVDGVATEVGPDRVDSTALAASADGSIVVGSVQYGDLTMDGFRWTASEGATIPYPGYAWDISDDGSVVVGSGFRWTALGGLQTLAGGAYGVSPDGCVAVGVSSTGGAAIWNEHGSMHSIQAILESSCGLDLTGWTLTEACGVAADGLTIVGNGINPSGYTEAWIAVIPEPATLVLLTIGGVAVLRHKRSHMGP